MDFLHGVWKFQSRVSTVMLGHDFLGDLVAKLSDAALKAFIVPALALIIAAVVGTLTYFYFIDAFGWTVVKLWVLIRGVMLACVITIFVFITFLMVIKLGAPYEETLSGLIMNAPVLSTPPSTVKGFCVPWIPDWICKTWGG